MDIKSYLRRLKKLPIILGVVVVLIGAVILNRGEEAPQSLGQVDSPRTAKVTTAEALLVEGSSTLIGNIRPMSAVSITPDRSGRVTRVNTALSSRVVPGQVIVELENSAERAALLQAEGAYEVARIQATVSDIGLNEAEALLRTSITAGHNAKLASNSVINDVVRNTIDRLFSEPNSQIPGLRLDARGDTTFLNQERVAFQLWLNQQQTELVKINEPNLVATSLLEQISRVDRLVSFIENINFLLSDQRSTRGFSAGEITALQTQFNVARNQLIGSRVNLNLAQAEIEAALDGLRRASAQAQNTPETSAGTGQLKQALGVLRAAQANFEKTLLRTPIAGTVNSLNVQVGDFVSAFTPLAEVANNNQLEVVTFVSDNERALLSVGQLLTVDNATGTVTAIAQAIDPNTRRTEVRISVPGETIRAGDTVRVSIDNTRLAGVDQLRIPLTAIQITNGTETVLGVEDGVVVARPVEIGVIRGGTVEILAGLTPSDEFILDARPFRVGQAVTVTR